MKTHIHIIKMGGTIEFYDPAYDAINTKLLKLDTTIDSFLHNLIQPNFNFSTETVAQKDSRELNDTDRTRLAEAIATTPHENLIVTHGTFTMKETCEFLESRIPSDKKVIVTGSMIPITGFAASDAGFNLGFAIASLPAIKRGVWLSMNGGIFHSDEIKKNPEAFRFE